MTGAQASFFLSLAGVVRSVVMERVRMDVEAQRAMLAGAEHRANVIDAFAVRVIELLEKMLLLDVPVPVASAPRPDDPPSDPVEGRPSIGRPSAGDRSVGDESPRGPTVSANPANHRAGSYEGRPRKAGPREAGWPDLGRAATSAALHMMDGAWRDPHGGWNVIGDCGKGHPTAESAVACALGAFARYAIEKRGQGDLRSFGAFRPRVVHGGVTRGERRDPEAKERGPFHEEATGAYVPVSDEAIGEAPRAPEKPGESSKPPSA